MPAQLTNTTWFEEHVHTRPWGAYLPAPATTRACGQRTRPQSACTARVRDGSENLAQRSGRHDAGAGRMHNKTAHRADVHAIEAYVQPLRVPWPLVGPDDLAGSPPLTRGAGLIQHHRCSAWPLRQLPGLSLPQANAFPCHRSVFRCRCRKHFPCRHSSSAWATGSSCGRRSGRSGAIAVPPTAGTRIQRRPGAAGEVAGARPRIRRPLTDLNRHG
jgi:hypothetical protein